MSNLLGLYHEKIPERLRDLIFCILWLFIGVISYFVFKGFGDKTVPADFVKYFSKYFPYNPADGDSIYILFLYTCMTVFFLTLFFILPAIFRVISHFLQFLSDLKMELVIKLS